ncbi:hypothetical protein EOM81_13035 [bacterium]|nr:hypothetical protein [bacterium]
MKKQFVSSAEVQSLIDGVIDGQIFSLIFDRVAPKCSACDKSNKKWAGLDRCPVCGEVLSKERFTRAQKGVSNPSTAMKPGTGLYAGVSAQEAAQNGILKFFDMDAKNKAGGRGDYRSARFETIKRLAISGTEYIVR